MDNSHQKSEIYCSNSFFFHFFFMLIRAFRRCIRLFMASSLKSKSSIMSFFVNPTFNKQHTFISSFFNWGFSPVKLSMKLSCIACVITNIFFQSCSVSNYSSNMFNNLCFLWDLFFYFYST